MSKFLNQAVQFWNSNVAVRAKQVLTQTHRIKFPWKNSMEQFRKKYEEIEKLIEMLKQEKVSLNLIKERFRRNLVVVGFLDRFGKKSEIYQVAVLENQLWMDYLKKQKNLTPKQIDLLLDEAIQELQQEVRQHSKMV